MHPAGAAGATGAAAAGAAATGVVATGAAATGAAATGADAPLTGAAATDADCCLSIKMPAPNETCNAKDNKVYFIALMVVNTQLVTQILEPERHVNMTPLLDQTVKSAGISRLYPAWPEYPSNQRRTGKQLWTMEGEGSWPIWRCSSQINYSFFRRKPIEVTNGSHRKMLASLATGKARLVKSKHHTYALGPPENPYQLKSLTVTSR